MLSLNALFQVGEIQPKMEIKRSRGQKELGLILNKVLPAKLVNRWKNQSHLNYP